MKRGVTMETIGERIKQRRIQLNISQDELAKSLGYKSRSSINKIEKDGRELPQSKILAIANALSTTPSYIMGWEENPNKQVLEPEFQISKEEETIISKYRQLSNDNKEEIKMLINFKLDTQKENAHPTHVEAI